MKSPRFWQYLVIVLLTVTLTINLRLLLVPSNETEDNGIALEKLRDMPQALCDKPVVFQIESKADVKALNASIVQTKWLQLGKDEAKVVGTHRPQKGFLTIGVPSIKRINGMTYLMQTISSLIEHTSKEEKMSVVVVVFLADFDTEYNNKVLASLTEQFMDYINLGFIHIVQVSRSFYPPLEGLKRNFQDKPERVTWRAKQTVDFAFMFLYSKNLSEYYIQIEDDVQCAQGFVSGIRSYIKTNARQQWAVLEFSELGFIGKLFRTSDLDKLSRYMLTFYDEQPVDWLIKYFRFSMAQRKEFLRKPTLFQHIGLKSSFDITKDNKLKDKFFDSGEKPWRSDDPPAQVVTTMGTYENYGPSLAYGSGSGYFWAPKVKDGDWFALVFEEAVNLQRVIVETGDPIKRKDQLLNGTVEVCQRLLKFDAARKDVLCAKPRRIGTFESGRFDVADLDNSLHHEKVKCLKIIVTRNENGWLAVHQIAVFIVPDS